MRSHWRQTAATVIDATLCELVRDEPDADERRKRQVLRAAYPFGERARHPYKIWCDEINRQLGKKPPLGSRRSLQPAEGQQELF